MLKRLNKKGVTHADWAISMGIFIIYVSFLIVFILPSLLKTQFDPSPLFSSFEENFLKPLEWSVVKIPLNIIKLENSVDVGGNSLNVRLTVSITDDDHRFTKIDPSVDIDLTTYSDTIPEQNLNPSDELNGLRFTDENNKIKMILGCNSNSECDGKILNYTVAPTTTKKLPKVKPNCNILDEEACKFFLGIEEEIKGIKEKPFLTEGGESASFESYKNGQFYSLLKTENLKFPENKDFDILYQEDINGDGIVGDVKKSIFEKSNKKPPTVPENANVFIKEYKKFYVSHLGDLKPVIFYFEVW